MINLPTNKMEYLLKKLCFFVLTFCLLSSQCEKKDEDSNVVETNNQILDESEYKSESKFIWNAVDIINKEFSSPDSKVVSGELNQSIVDYYLELVGLDKGAANVSDVEKALLKLKTLNKLSKEEYIENLPYSEFTKNKLKGIYDGKVISNLEGFRDLKLEEKKLLLRENILLKEYKSREYLHKNFKNYKGYMYLYSDESYSKKARERTRKKIPVWHMILFSVFSIK